MRIICAGRRLHTGTLAANVHDNWKVKFGAGQNPVADRSGWRGSAYGLVTVQRQQMLVQRVPDVWRQRVGVR